MTHSCQWRWDAERLAAALREVECVLDPWHPPNAATLIGRGDVARAALAAHDALIEVDA